MNTDRFGNPHAPGLNYAHGEYIRSSKDDHVNPAAFRDLLFGEAIGLQP